MKIFTFYALNSFFYLPLELAILSVYYLNIKRILLYLLPELLDNNPFAHFLEFQIRELIMLIGTNNNELMHEFNNIQRVIVAFKH